MRIGKIDVKRRAGIQHIPLQNRPPETLIRDLQKLEKHPLIGKPAVDLVAVSMNLAMNTRKLPVDKRNGIVAEDVSRGLIHGQLEKVNKIIEELNRGLPEDEKISLITVEEIFNLIYSRWRNG